MAPISFRDVSSTSGVNFVLDASPTSAKHQPETMAGGVALLDYNGDGLLDIYMVNGADMPSLEKRGAQYKNRLFRNNGNLTFTDVTDEARVAGTGYGIGVAVADYDNDGHPDIFVANVNRNQLLHNNGDGTFSDVTAAAGLTGALHHDRKVWSVAAAWLDYNNDGLLDLFVSNYSDWDPQQEPACSIAGLRAYCDPTHYAPVPNTLYRNNGDGTFTDVSVQTGIAQHPGRNMGVAIADYDHDGFPDIFVANDKAPNLLFHNVRGNHFEEVGVGKMVAYSEDGLMLSGMGADFKDVNNDGKPDIWYTAVERQTFPLLLGTVNGFVDDTRRSGLTRETLPMSGWSNGMVDFDNDGWKDLFVARSNVLDNVAAFSDRQYREPNSIFRNAGFAVFQDVSDTAGADIQAAGAFRGAAFGDLDNDGKMDIVVTQLNGPAKVLHNITASSNHWLTICLRGVRSNRMGIGASLILTFDNGQHQYGYATTSVGYASSSDSRVQFGLGRAERVRTLEIEWPGGIRQSLHDVFADQVLHVVEGEIPPPSLR
jgi:enediyne biosynthesis protein E4